MKILPLVMLLWCASFGAFAAYTLFNELLLPEPRAFTIFIQSLGVVVQTFFFCFYFKMHRRNTK